MLKVFGVIWLMAAAGLVVALANMSKTDGAGNTGVYLAMVIWFSVALILTLTVVALPWALPRDAIAQARSMVDSAWA